LRERLEPMAWDHISSSHDDTDRSIGHEVPELSLLGLPLARCNKNLSRRSMPEEASASSLFKLEGFGIGCRDPVK
jgi:hypothetical protein